MKLLSEYFLLISFLFPFCFLCASFFRCLSHKILFLFLFITLTTGSVFCQLNYFLHYENQNQKENSLKLHTFTTTITQHKLSPFSLKRRTPFCRLLLQSLIFSFHFFTRNNHQPSFCTLFSICTKTRFGSQPNFSLP